MIFQNINKDRQSYLASFSQSANGKGPTTNWKNILLSNVSQIYKSALNLIVGF